MDLDLDGTQFTNGDIGAFGPKTDPFMKPGTVNRDRAFMAITHHVRMDIFDKFIHLFVDQQVPMLINALPDFDLGLIPMFRDP